MSVAHSTLSGANLHENKGVATATDDHVLTADTGASVWKKLTPDNLDLTALFTINTVALTFTFPDISEATTEYFVVPFAGTLIKAYSVIQAAITTGDAVLTFKNAAGTSMGSGTITVTQSGSAAGDIDSCSPASNNTFVAGTALRVSSDGGSDTVCPARITLIFTVTGVFA